MRTLKWHEGDPSKGPLDGRAWTLQELLLARRMVAFMPDSISWICDGATVTETGRELHYTTRRYTWFVMLVSYTKRSLTFASDRREAVQGIASLYQGFLGPGLTTNTCRPYQVQLQDQYISEYGVWKENLAFQLLWSKAGRPVENSHLAHIPSWSWAATGFAKMWPSGTWASDPKSESCYMRGTMSKRLVLTSAGHLEILGHLSTVQLPPIARDEQVEVSEFHDELWFTHWGYGANLSRNGDSGYFGLDESQVQLILGLARFDEDTTTECTHAWLVLRRPENKDTLYTSDVEDDDSVRKTRASTAY